jgi:hypothetical protein
MQGPCDPSPQISEKTCVKKISRDDAVPIATRQPSAEQAVETVIVGYRSMSNDLAHGLKQPRAALETQQKRSQVLAERPLGLRRGSFELVEGQPRPSVQAVEGEAAEIWLAADEVVQVVKLDRFKDSTVQSIQFA